ncbi:hypothetical protein Tco_0704008 [Tanacetum coccineum]|uniref:Integrase catalytic domain-containing protein n=1 Tax=Tanacetum coccineum TaxID=301880 RepID=A0ABQ4Y1W2_9ASTR
MVMPYGSAFEGPYTPTTVVVPAVPATENSPAVPEQTTVEIVLNMSPANKAHFESEKEVIHLILTGIGDEIYSTVDACKTAHEMWEAIERLQQGESLNIQDVKTNLFWEFGQFTSHDGETIESYYTRFYKMMNEMIRNNLTVATMQVNVQFLQQLQPEWSRFVTIVKQQHKLDEVSYHKLFDILKQYQKEVNELHAERIAKNANPLALAWVKHSNGHLHLHAPTAHDMEILIKTCLMPFALKTQNDSFAFVHELKHEMHAVLKGNDLLTGNHGSDLYTISLQETTSSTLICLMAKAITTQAWVLASKKFIQDKDCPKLKGQLNLLHMDLCGPMRVASINGKKYILLIVDDYSRYTWTLFLRSKDETPEVLKDFLMMIQRNLQAPVISVRTDRGTEFLNKTLNAFFKEEGIEHQTSTP